MTARLSLIDGIQIRPIQPDNFNDVRYVHTTAFRSHAYSFYTPEELDAFEMKVRAPNYLDRFMSNPILGAWLGRELIATAAWHRPEPNDRVGRLSALFVQPLFSRAGIGTMMLQSIESSAAATGCRLVSVASPLSAQNFFETNGYELSGRGTSPLIQAKAIDVLFMRKPLPAQNQTERSPCYN